MKTPARALVTVVLPLAAAVAVACSSFSPADEGGADAGGADAEPVLDAGTSDVIEARDASTVDAPVDAAPCDAAADPDRACDERFVFTTLGTVPGNFGALDMSLSALEVADRFCESQAMNAGTSVVQGRKWKAFLCGIGSNAVDRVATKDWRWINISHEVAFADTAALRAGKAMRPLGGAGAEAWTGCASTGAPAADLTCSDWTSVEGQGTYGKAEKTLEWGNAGASNCSSQHSIYCFEDAAD